MNTRVRLMTLSVLEGIFLVKQYREQVCDAIAYEVDIRLKETEHPSISHVQAAVEKVLKTRICKERVWTEIQQNAR